MGGNYNFDTHTTRGSVTIEVDTWINAYMNGVNSRQGNGYGTGGAAYAVADFLGTATAGYLPSDDHDTAYELGLNKNTYDFGLFKGMVSGSISNLSQRNGGVRAAIGLAISPLYYGAVACCGDSAYRAAPLK